jgi:branched-chain amino acid transport system ATP-binding protein
LLLLDEPTAGMGPEETKDMVALIERLAAERTILLVEHKMKMILGLSDRILVLHHGKLIADGSPQQIQSDPEVRRVYLGQSHGYA